MSKVPSAAFGVVALDIGRHPYTQDDAHTPRPIAETSPAPDVSNLKQTDPTPSKPHTAPWTWALAAAIVVAVIVAFVHHMMAHQNDPLIHLRHDEE